jgi:hypothetical protein
MLIDRYIEDFELRFYIFTKKLINKKSSMKTQNFIYISAIFLCFLFTANAQNNKDFKMIMGTVIDSERNPLKGVFIFIDSVNTEVQTNRKGYYEITPNSKVNYISVYSAKHGVLTVNYSGQKEVDFIFSSDSKKLSKKQLDQLGFITPTRNKSTKVNFEGVQGINAFNDIYQMLIGRVAGVSVSGQSISIRGASGAARGRGISTQPLFLVNGATVSDISNIAPSDVKEIEVIKGPETAFYGSRGVYGVLKITLRDK